MKKGKYLLVLFALGLILLTLFLFRDKPLPKNDSSNFHFSGSGKQTTEIIEETNKMENSKSPDWWLNSGGILKITEKEFSTNIGDLEKKSRWQKLYKKNNSQDTDGGYHPQNLFRLVTRGKWENFSQTLYFKIEDINLSESENRNQSNGVLLLNRYQDGDNLYYTGFRVDGDAVIKKKIDGKYYTMAEKKLFAEDGEYDRIKNPNLLPENKWVGIKSELNTNSLGMVNVKLFADKDGTGNWELVLEKTDFDKKYGGSPFESAGHGGIRTDFMDVSFKDYEIL